jgi:putative peptidoglycan lipid II flippase
VTDTRGTALVRTAVGVAILLVIAKAIGFAKEAYLANRLGTSALADAYQVGLTFSTWFSVTVVSAFSTVWVPLLVQSAHWRPDRAAQFVRRSNWTVFALGGASVVVTLAIAVVSLGLSEPAQAGNGQHAAFGFTFWFLLLAMQTVLVGYLVARLMAGQSHGYALAEAVPAIMLVLVVMFFDESIEIGLIAGTLIGAATHLAALGILLRMRGAPLHGFEIPRRDELIKGAALAFAALLPSQIAIGSTAPIDMLLAKSLGQGEVATYGYALRLVALATGITAVALTRVLLPVLSEMVARGDAARAFALAKRWVWLMLAVGGAAAAVLWLVATPLVRIAFERGAFAASDTAAVAATLRILALQMPMFFAGIVWVQWLAANRRTRDIARITFVQVIVKIVASVVLMQWLGLQGIALATVLMYFVALVWLSRATMPGSKGGSPSGA